MGGYFIPEELRDEKDAFVFSFANRTKRNLKHIERIAEIEKANGTSVQRATVFEVTQLINSMIGLVTFPKEAFFDRIDAAHAMNTSDKLENLIRSICNNPSKYEYRNTYLWNTGCTRNIQGKERAIFELNRYERLDTMSLIRHIRNAMSHEKLSVFPYNLSPDEEIKCY